MDAPSSSTVSRPVAAHRRARGESLHADPVARQSDVARSDRRQRLRRWLLAAIPLLLALAGYAVQSIRVPAGSAEGTAFGEPAQVAPRTSGAVRVAVWNIHGCRGADGRRDLSRTASYLRGIDLVALSEVHGPKLLRRVDQCQTLGEDLGMRWLFAPAEWRWYHGSFGNGMLTTLPVAAWRREVFPLDGANTHRNFVWTVLEVEGRPWHVLATHLDSRDAQRRRSQLQTLAELFLSLDEPVVLLGDMNMTATDPQMQALLTSPGVVDVLAATDGAATRIDWILARGLDCRAAGRIDEGASDHPLYWAELVLPETDLSGAGR